MEKPRLFLFGRTGCGKSTVANMLARGHLDPPLLFQTSSGARGQTLSTQTEECEDMVIVDTVGLGEPDLGSVSHEEAMNILYNSFLEVRDGFHHFAFVRRWSRNDALDEQLWAFFKQAFKGAERNFVVIFTGVGKLQEIELQKPETKEVLLKFYDPCQRWVFVNFGGQGKKAVNRSLTNLQTKLSEFRGPAIAPEVCKHLRLGRILLLGGSEKSSGILANLLVNGCSNLEKATPVAVEGCKGGRRHGLVFERDQRMHGLDVHVIAEGKGRRWQVVEVLVDLQKLGSGEEPRRQVAAMILRCLMQEEGFTHVVLVHEYTQLGESNRSAKLLWKMLLALFNGPIRNERLMVVIARDSQEILFGEGAESSNSWFPGCQKLVHLDLPLNMQIEGPERLRTALRIFKQALQIKEVSTFFHIARLSDSTDLNHLIGELRVESSKGIVFTVFTSPLSKLASAYRKIVNHQETQIVVWTEGEQGNPADPDFCETSQLVVGYRCNFRYLTMKVMRDTRPVQGIRVTVMYQDESQFFSIDDFISWGRPQISWAQLAVLAAAPAGIIEEIGERMSVYTNDVQFNELVVHSATITESSFLVYINEYDCDIALFLNSNLRLDVWCSSYTYYASLHLIRC